MGSPLHSAENTDRKRTLVELFDFAPLPCLGLDSRGNILEINRTGVRFLNVSRSSLRGIPLSFYIQENDVEFFKDKLWEALSKQRPSRVSVGLSLQRDKPLQVLIDITPLSYIESSFPGVERKDIPLSGSGAIVNITDITELHEEKSYLERFYFFLENVPGAILVINKHARIIYFNSESGKLFQIAEDSLGADYSNLLPESIVKKINSISFDGTMLPQSISMREELRFVRDGRSLQVDLRFSSDSINNDYARIIEITDISSGHPLEIELELENQSQSLKIKKLEFELSVIEQQLRKKIIDTERLQAEIQKLRVGTSRHPIAVTQHPDSLSKRAHEIAHSINNPLGSILLAAQYAHRKQAQLGNFPDLDKSLRDIIAEAKKCGKMLRQYRQD
jgi:PAS domain-containing protein